MILPNCYHGSRCPLNPQPSRFLALYKGWAMRPGQELQPDTCSLKGCLGMVSLEPVATPRSPKQEVKTKCIAILSSSNISPLSSKNGCYTGFFTWICPRNPKFTDSSSPVRWAVVGLMTSWMMHRESLSLRYTEFHTRREIRMAPGAVLESEMFSLVLFHIRGGKKLLNHTLLPFYFTPNNRGDIQGYVHY